LKAESVSKFLSVLKNLISFFFFRKPNLSFVVKGAGSEGFSVESLFGIPDPRQRPSSTTFQPIGK
jgi:hypothetical protein